MPTPGRWTTVDGNEAAARVAYGLAEIIAIYPITPSSSMGELADAWMAERRPNVWGAVPVVSEMQSEAGAAGALHGAVQSGALATSFTASQGLLLMVPNMFKIAGQLLPCVLHVSARAVATHALSIFGDHSDVMAVRSTGWAQLCSGSVQEAQDLAAIAHASSLDARLPFVHFFDGFRTSHEVAKIRALTDDDLRALIDEGHIGGFRARALTPDHPVLRGSAQNPDVFFQAREAANPYYLNTPGAVERHMRTFAALTGRRYHLFDYEGSPDAERVLVVMGSAAETAAETVAALNARGEKVGLVKVRLFRPFSVSHFVRALPATVRHIAVLDRTKEPGAVGEPLYQDVVTAIHEAINASDAPFRFVPRVIGGRYGLGSKEFTPSMVAAVFDELDEAAPRSHFTVGIADDVSFASLPCDEAFTTEDPQTIRAVFYGVGSDGTVGANKNSIKIIGEETDLHAQGYFVYDSKKSGSTTVSHLRFGPRPIRSSYLVGRAEFVACHQWELLSRVNVLEHAADEATVLVNSPYPAGVVWNEFDRRTQQQILEKRLRLFVIDAARIALDAGTGRRVNTVLQTCFFALSGVLPRERAIEAIKHAVAKTYAAKGDEVLRANFAAIDAALAGLQEVEVPLHVTAPAADRLIPDDAPEFVRTVIGPLLEGHGDLLPVSALSADGTFPMGTSRWEKRNIAEFIPVWDEVTCIQCNKCALVCPHAAVRVKVYEGERLAGAPGAFKAVPYRGTEFAGREMTYTVQVAPEDCTGCELCVEVCPARDKASGVKALRMEAQRPLRVQERENYAFFLGLPEMDRGAFTHASVKGSQFLQPLFEYSGACSGCGETPYLKLATQLFGDRMVIANATGCSSIFGGNLPTSPWACNDEGRGPAWANSLFEDNAEFGYGMRLAIDAHAADARRLLRGLEPVAGSALCDDILASRQTDESDIHDQRTRVALLKQRLRTWLDATTEPASALVGQAWRLLAVADYLVKKSVWIVGGDGWAYDIGYGGLDHVLASDRNVNVLVLDTEVYSNTGGQASKATPRGAVARFAASGKRTGKKDLGLLAMTYGHIYVAHVALGANDTQTVRAFLEAESYDGPSLVIAYAHCIAHGIEIADGLGQQGRAVASGHWPLLRFDPRAAGSGRFPLTLDSKPPKIAFTDYAYRETRYRSLTTLDRAAAEQLAEQAQRDVTLRWRLYEQLAAMRLE